MASYEAIGISVRYGSRTVLDEVSFVVEPGSMTALVGPNGAGKSTLLKAMTGGIGVSKGSVCLDGESIDQIPPRLLARRRAVLPQASPIAFPVTVYEIVRLGLDVANVHDRTGSAVAAALARVELNGFGNRLLQELSGGERQRVHLARVLAQVPPSPPGEPPRYLFLDEPTTGLDLRHQLMVLNAARQFAVAGGGVLAVLHDLNLAATFADRIAVVRDGAVAAIGPTAEVVTDAMLRETYDIEIGVSRPPTTDVPYVLPQSARLPHSAD